MAGSDAPDAHGLQYGGHAADEERGEHGPGKVALALPCHLDDDNDTEHDAREDGQRRLDARAHRNGERRILIRLVSHCRIDLL